MNQYPYSANGWQPLPPSPPVYMPAGMPAMPASFLPHALPAYPSFAPPQQHQPSPYYNQQLVPPQPQQYYGQPPQPMHPLPAHASAPLPHAYQQAAGHGKVKPFLSASAKVMEATAAAVTLGGALSQSSLQQDAGDAAGCMMETLDSFASWA